MHNAPAVSYPVGRSVWSAIVLCALSTLGLISAGLLVWQMPPHAWESAVLLLMVWLLSVIWGARSWLRSPQGQLRWDGQLWYWADKPGLIRVGFDAQRLLWIQWSAQDGLSRRALWLCLESGQSPQQWLDLRRAVYSPGHVSSPAPSL